LKGTPESGVFCGSGFFEEQLRRDLLSASDEELIQKPYEIDSSLARVKNAIALKREVK